MEEESKCVCSVVHVAYMKCKERPFTAIFFYYALVLLTLVNIPNVTFHLSVSGFVIFQRIHSISEFVNTNKKTYNKLIKPQAAEQPFSRKYSIIYKTVYHSV